MISNAPRKWSARGVYEQRRWRAVVRRTTSGRPQGFVDAWWPDGSYLGRFRIDQSVRSTAELHHVAARVLRATAARA